MVHSRASRFRAPHRLTKAVVLCALAAVVATSHAAAQPGASEPGHFDNQVAPGAYRLDGRDPGLPNDDLAPLRRIVGSAKFVGLGEPLHTSGGYYLLKHRMFRFLVEEMGFRVFGFESPRSWVEQLDAYVQTCAGTAEEAVNGLFTVTRSTETAALARWMCEWNQDHPGDRIHVYGFDIQRQPQVDAAGLIAFLQRLGAPGADAWIAGIEACDGVAETFYPALPFPQERYDRCQGVLAEVGAYFDAHEKEVVRATSRRDLGWARVYLASAAAWQEEIFFIRSDFGRGYGARERGMAYSLLAIHELRFPHAKTVLWAANGHLWRDSITASDLPGTDLPALGDLLDAALGRRYVVIGQVALATYADWPAAGLCGFVDLLLENPVEEVFHQVGEELLLVDLAPRGNHPGLLPPGATYSVQGSDPIVPARHLDALVYQEVSPAMHPLAWAPCQ